MMIPSLFSTARSPAYATAPASAPVVCDVKCRARFHAWPPQGAAWNAIEKHQTLHSDMENRKSCP